MSTFHRSSPGSSSATQLGMFTVAMRSATWVFAKEPYTRLPICKSGNGLTNEHNGHVTIKHHVPLTSALWNAWDLMVNLRGIGWNWSHRTHIPRPFFHVESRLTFTLLSLCQCILLMIAFDALCVCARSLGPDTFGTPEGGTIFDPSLPPTERYMKSLTVTFLSGITAYVIINATYQFHAVLYMILFQQYPSQWPPLFDSPWLSTSLTSFWGRRWHQLFREYFVAVGSRSMRRYLGRVGTVMGAFAVSGVLHDVGMQGMGRGADTLTVVGFFLMHGVAVLLEHAWKQATGRRVGGVFGWLWACLWLILWGQAVVDVWARRGLIGSQFFPEAYRPATLILNWISRKNGAS